MTPLQQRIYDDLEVHGASTVHEIAARIESTPRAVSTSLTFMAGRGLADEVGEHTCAVYDRRYPGAVLATDDTPEDAKIKIGSTRYPPGPRRWTLEVNEEFLHPTVLAERRAELGTPA